MQIRIAGGDRPEYEHSTVVVDAETAAPEYADGDVIHRVSRGSMARREHRPDDRPATRMSEPARGGTAALLRPLAAVQPLARFRNPAGRARYHRASLHQLSPRVGAVRFGGADQIRGDDAITAVRIVTDPCRVVGGRHPLGLEEARPAKRTEPSMRLRLNVGARFGPTLPSHGLTQESLEC